MTEDTYDHTGSTEGKSGQYVPRDVDAEDVIEELIDVFPDVEKVERKKGNRAEVRIPESIVPEVLTRFRDSGYDHFVALTCIDIIEESSFELVYHLFSYGSRVHVHVKTSVDRERPSIRSVVGVFRPAVTYEREIKEMFGVDFPGNPRLTQFILEDWEGPPPMRKDFDSIAYVRERYGIEVRNPKGLPPQPKKGGGS